MERQQIHAKVSVSYLLAIVLQELHALRPVQDQGLVSESDGFAGVLLSDHSQLFGKSAMSGI
jgi:hypothetical protein